MWHVSIEGKRDLELPELPYPECVIKYYKQLGPDVLAELTDKTRKQIINTASRHGAAKFKRDKYRTKEKRQEALERIREVHNRTDMTAAEKRAYVGARNASDYKHLATESGASEKFVDLWADYADRINAIILEAIKLEKVPLSHIKECHAPFYDDLLKGPADYDDLKLKKAIEHFIKKLEKEGHTVPKRGSFWAGHRPRMIRILDEQEHNTLTLLENLNTDEHKEFFCELLKTKTQSAIITAFRTLRKSQYESDSDKSTRSDFWDAHLNDMQAVFLYQQQHRVGVIRALKTGFPRTYEALKRHKTDAAINHAFQSAYRSFDGDDGIILEEWMGFDEA